MPPEIFDVVVVGTGWNGLISAKTYLDFDANANLVLVDEQATIGGAWSDEKIYPGLFAQIKYGQFEYSFYPMRHEGVTKDGYISGQTINNYLKEFAAEFGLIQRTRLRTKVVQVTRRPDGGWRLNLESGKEAIECAKLIYASGAASHPVIPQWPCSERFNVPIVHSSEIRSHVDKLQKIRRATVIGAAKSAYDTVFLLLQYGVQVNWIIRENSAGPMAIMPPTILGICNTMDAVSTELVSHLGSSIMQTKGTGYWLFNRTFIGRSIAKIFWKTIAIIAARHAGYDKSPNAQKLKPVPHGNGIFWANAGLGCASVPNFWKAFHEGDCKVHKTEIASLSASNTVELSNGAHFDTDYIILCTGFDKSYHHFSAELQETLGLVSSTYEQVKWAKLEAKAEKKIDQLLPAIRESPITTVEVPSRSAHLEKLLHGPSRHYRRLIVPDIAAKGDRSIYFPGFIDTIYTPLVAEVQALWGVAFLLGLVDLPSQGDMEAEVADWNVWTRKRYLAQGKKHAYAIYDFFAYINLLLGDLGINGRRKSTALAELFLPKYPRDYKGITDEFRRALSTRQGKAYAKGTKVV
ncbi:hypothetical protein JX265_012422 [Neoarthrinium moseri]|uniref:Uncharacterized protein n=1 Tax=Neoarthrinium moseri TaxID=1658444 RepID=A0A9P9WAD8_9PEZI|nr:hypothetical protein JX265_012422 [Neoarthrinium moseri]